MICPDADTGVVLDEAMVRMMGFDAVALGLFVSRFVVDHFASSGPSSYCLFADASSSPVAGVAFGLEEAADDGACSSYGPFEVV